MKVGIDICSIKRIEDAYERYGERFLRRILTSDEIKYVEQSPRLKFQRLAGRFAAKEATAKALGTGWVGVDWKEVEVLHKVSGEPYIRLHSRALARARSLDLSSFELSISHEREFATAIVMGYARN